MQTTIYPSNKPLLQTQTPHRACALWGFISIAVSYAVNYTAFLPGTMLMTTATPSSRTRTRDRTRIAVPLPEPLF